jgi:DNA-binding NarL/FixJ family response regulator
LRPPTLASSRPAYPAALNQKEQTMSAATVNGTVPLKVLTVDDHPLTREALARVISEIAPRVEMIEAGTLASAQAALAAHADIRLVVLDPALPDATGIEAVKCILAARPEIAVLVLAAQDDPATARAAMEAGARGFISRRSSTRVFTEVLRLVLVGGTYVPPEALRAVAAPSSAPSAPPPAAENSPAALHKALGLTPRQLEVLTLLAQGKPNKLICRALDLREGTIKTHISAIYRALGVANRTEAVYAMNRLGVTLPVETTPPARTLARERFRPHVGPGWMPVMRQLQAA